MKHKLIATILSASILLLSSCSATPSDAPISSEPNSSQTTSSETSSAEISSPEASSSEISSVNASSAEASSTSSSKEVSTSNETVSSKPTATKSTKSDTKNLEEWALSMTALFMIDNGHSANSFGGRSEIYDAGVTLVKGSLEKGWGVTNRAQLLEKINWLLVEGHRVPFVKSSKELIENPEKYRELLKEQNPIWEQDELWQLQLDMVTAEYDKWKENSMLAWDMNRISLLAQWGYYVGYVTKEEACALIEPAAKKLKAAFNNWDDVNENYLQGYGLWVGDQTSYEYRKEAVQKAKQRSAEYGWNLFDNKLFSADIVAVNGVSYQSLLK